MLVLRKSILYFQIIKFGLKCHLMKRNIIIVIFRRILNKVPTFNQKDSKNYARGTSNYSNNSLNIRDMMKCSN